MRIADQLALHETPLPPRADLAFVFGTRFREPADVALDLYDRGLVGRIVLTGGVNRRTGIGEARAHESILLAAGVPADRLIVEDASTNTLENVELALPAISAVLPPWTLTAVVAVAKWHHARRAVMTLRRHLPGGIRYHVRTYEPPDVPRDGWHRSPDARAALRKERERIPRYLGQGHIAAIRFDGGAYI